MEPAARPDFHQEFPAHLRRGAGIDSRPLVDEYRLQHEHPDAAHEPIMPSSRRGGDSGERASTAYRFAVAAIVLLIVVLVALLVLGKGSSKSRPSGVEFRRHALAACHRAGTRVPQRRVRRAPAPLHAARGGPAHALIPRERIHPAGRKQVAAPDDRRHRTSISAGGAFTVTAAGAQDAGSEGRLRACG